MSNRLQFRLLRYQKDNKDIQIARHATESYEDSKCDFENSERDWWVLDATDKCATVCHGMSKSLLLIVSTRIVKIKIIYLEKKGCREILNGLGLVLCKGVNTHWVYMKYDCKVFSRGMIRYLLGYM